MNNGDGRNQSAVEIKVKFSAVEQSVHIYIDKALENRTRFPDKALEWAKTALHSSRTLDNPRLLAAALNTHASISVFINHLISAEQNAEEALSVSNKIHYDRGRADAFCTLGTVLLKRGSHDEALQLFLESLSIYDRLKCLSGRAGVLNQLGVVYHHFGKVSKALAYFEEAREIYENLDDKNSVADELNNIGLVKRNMNELDSALLYLDKAVDLYRETGNSTANVLLNIAGVHESKGNIDKAFDTYAESLSIAENRQDSYRMAIATMKIGRLMIDRRRYEDAYGYLVQSFRLAHSLGIKELQKEVYETISMMYKLAGDYRRAFRYYRAGVSLKDEIVSTEKNDRIAELYIQHELRKKEKEAKKYKRRSRKFEKLSKVDELTGLFNRRITVSFGLSAIEDGISCTQMIESADKRLYEAKQAGRNRIRY